MRLGASEMDCTARDAEILPRCVVHNVMLTFMRRLMAAEWCPSHAFQACVVICFHKRASFVIFISFLFAFIDSFISIYITSCYQHTKCYQQVLLLHFAKFYSSIYSMSRLNFHYAVYSYSFIHEFDWPKLVCSLVDDYRGFGESDCFHVQGRCSQERKLIHSFSILSDDRSKASSSKTMSPYSAIQSLLLQMRISSPVLKVIQ